jgi:sugar lactone lactonase YvrE
MKGITGLLVGVTVVLVAAPGAAETQYYLVSGYVSDNVVRYNALTGAFMDEFVPASSGGLNAPEGLAIGPDGNLYVASANTHSIKRYDGGTGAYMGDFATDNGLNYPRGIAFGPDGNLYVSSSNDKVLRFNGTTGAFIDEFVPYGTPNLTDPQDLVFRGDGNLYISNGWTASVIRCNAGTGAYIDTFVQGPQFAFVPQGMAFGADSNLYVADSEGSAVWRYDGVTGNLIDAFVPGGAGGLFHAEDVLFGLDGNLYVTSHYTDEVLRYNGVTGAPMGVFASGGGLVAPTYMLFVPEPGSLALLAVAGLLLVRRR